MSLPPYNSDPADSYQPAETLRLATAMADRVIAECEVTTEIARQVAGRPPYPPVDERLRAAARADRIDVYAALIEDPHYVPEPRAWGPHTERVMAGEEYAAAVSDRVRSLRGAADELFLQLGHTRPSESQAIRDEVATARAIAAELTTAGHSTDVADVYTDDVLYLRLRGRMDTPQSLAMTCWQEIQALSVDNIAEAVGRIVARSILDLADGDREHAHLGAVLARAMAYRSPDLYLETVLAQEARRQTWLHTTLRVWGLDGLLAVPGLLLEQVLPHLRWAEPVKAAMDAAVLQHEANAAADRQPGPSDSTNG